MEEACVVQLDQTKAEDECCSNLSLRRLEESDLDDFMVWATDEKVTRFCTWEPYTNKEDALKFIRNTVVPHPWFRAICVENRPIGAISVCASSPRPIGAISVCANSGNDKCRGELGYVLGSKYWGKGIATRAVKMVVDTIFVEWPHLERLEALVDVDNLGSQRVLEKAGFQREGVLRKYFILKGRSRDMVMFSLLSTEHHHHHHQISSINSHLRDQPEFPCKEPSMEEPRVVQLDQTKAAEDECSNLSLRPLEESDLDDFMVWATDERVARFCTWEPYTNKDDALKFIRNTAVPHPWYRAICVENRPIGAISVCSNSGNDKCRGELGYVLGYRYWGKGIATRAVKMMADTIFVEWPHLERLEALVDVDNLGSQRVLEKAGFQREGVLRKYLIMKGRSRDRVMFSLLSADHHHHRT